MRRSIPVVLVALAIVASSSNAFAGHEWSDGTMGPPQGRWYDTTMPQFPSVRTPRSALQGTATCSNSAKPDPKPEPASTVDLGHSSPQRSLASVGAVADETCSNVHQIGP